MGKILNIIFIGDNGKLSMTGLFAIVSFAIIMVLFVRGLWFDTPIDNAWLVWSISLIEVAVLGRAGQRGLQFLGEGIANVGSRKVSKTEPNEPPQKTVAQPTLSRSSHFDISEFNSKDGASMPRAAALNVTKVISNLEVIREACGGLPVTILSGYRSKAHNTKVGGAKNSYHMKGMASDIRVKGVPTKKLYAIIEDLMDNGKIQHGGLGYYGRKRFVHYDIRGNKYKWNG